MAPSACDQKKAEIVRHAEMECSAEASKAKAIYELQCLEVRDKFKAKKEQAYRDLKQEERQELDEIKKLYEAGMEPINAKHAEKLSAIREQYRIAAPEASPHASAISETPSSPTLVTASQRFADEQHAEARNKNNDASDISIDDSQESGDETDNSIPFAAPTKKRKRVARTLDSEDEEPEFSQDEDKYEQDDNSGASLQGSQEQPSEGLFNPFMEASAQRNGRNTGSSASPTKIRNPFKTRNKAGSSSRKTDGQAEEGDEEEGTYSGLASQAPRRNNVRPGRPEPGKYRMNGRLGPCKGTTSMRTSEVDINT